MQNAGAQVITSVSTCPTQTTQLWEENHTPPQLRDNMRCLFSSGLQQPTLVLVSQ